MDKHGLVIRTETKNEYMPIVPEKDYLLSTPLLNGGSEYFYCINPIVQKAKGEFLVDPAYFKSIEKVAIPFILNENPRDFYSKKHADQKLREARKELVKTCRLLLQDFHLGEIAMRDCGDDMYCITSLLKPIINKSNKEEFLGKYNSFLKWLHNEIQNELFSVSKDPIWTVRLLGSRNPYMYGYPKTVEESFFTKGGNDFVKFILSEEATKPKDKIDNQIEQYNNQLNIETVIINITRDCYIMSSVDPDDDKILWMPCPITYMRTGQIDDSYSFSIDLSKNTFRDEHCAMEGSPLDLLNTLLYIQKSEKEFDVDFIKAITPEDFKKIKGKIIDIFKESNKIKGIQERPDGYYKIISKRRLWEPFTNFTMSIEKKIKNDNGEIIRIFKLNNGKDTAVVQIDNIGDTNRFKEKVQAVGDFFFSGNATDLTRMFQLVAQKDTQPFITGINKYGYFNKDGNDYYITDNLIIGKTGFYGIFRDGNFYVDGERFCLSLPRFFPRRDKICLEYKPIINYEVKQLLDITLNHIPKSRGVKQFVLAFGWLFATPFARIIKQEVDYRFPFLFINGISNEGKSKLGELMAYYSGFVPRSGIDCQDTSATAFKQGVSVYDSFHVSYDQFELNKMPEKRREYEDMLKGLYDSSQSDKSSPSGQMRTITPENICLSIIGEEMPQSLASRNRSVQIQMARADQDRLPKLYNMILGSQDRYSLVMAHYIRWMFKQKNLRERVKNLLGHSNMLTVRTQGIAVDREVKNFSIIIWGYKNLLDFAEYYEVITEQEKEEKLDEMWDVVCEAFQDQLTFGEEVKITSLFIDTINVMAYTGGLKNKIDYWIETEGNRKRLYLKFKTVWLKYGKYHRQSLGSNIQFKESEIRAALKAEGIALGNLHKILPTSIKQGSRRIIVDKGHTVMKIDISRPYPGAWKEFL